MGTANSRLILIRIKSSAQTFLICIINLEILRKTLLTYFHISTVKQKKKKKAKLKETDSSTVSFKTDGLRFTVWRHELLSRLVDSTSDTSSFQLKIQVKMVYFMHTHMQMILCGLHNKYNFAAQVTYSPGSWHEPHGVLLACPPNLSFLHKQLLFCIYRASPPWWVWCLCISACWGDLVF